MTLKIVAGCLMFVVCLISVDGQTANSGYKRRSRSKSGYYRNYKYGYKYRSRQRRPNAGNEQSEQNDLQSLEASGVEIRNVELTNAPAQKNEKPFASGTPFVVERPVAMQTMLEKAVADTLTKFADKNLTGENIAVTLIDLRDPNNLKAADYHGEIKIYPASVVKMFYLAATHRWLEDGKIKNTPELERGLHDMIVESSNDATQYIVDALTNTSSGAELGEQELQVFAEKRNAINRYFADLGFQNINVNQKTYCEDAYGREQQFRGKDGINRNKLTTNATARLLTEIALGKVVNQQRSQAMMDLMKRDWENKASGDYQAQSFSSQALPVGAKLWSKAGWTSQSRHDAAYIETASGQKFVVVTFTEKFASEHEIIPTIARSVLAELEKVK